MVLSTEKEAKSDEGAWNAFIEGWFNCHRKSAHRKRCLTLPCTTSPFSPCRVNCFPASNDSIPGSRAQNVSAIWQVDGGKTAAELCLENQATCFKRKEKHTCLLQFVMLQG